MILLDANILMYAASVEHLHEAPSLALLESMAAGHARWGPDGAAQSTDTPIFLELTPDHPVQDVTGTSKATSPRSRRSKWRRLKVARRDAPAFFAQAAMWAS